MAETVNEFFSQLPNNVDPDKVKGINATIQWDLEGDQGGKWNAVFSDGAVQVHEGAADNADTTLSAKASDWLDIVNGKLNGQMAFLTGKLKIKGDMSLVMKLQSLMGG